MKFGYWLFVPFHLWKQKGVMPSISGIIASWPKYFATSSGAIRMPSASSRCLILQQIKPSS